MSLQDTAESSEQNEKREQISLLYLRELSKHITTEIKQMHEPGPKIEKFNEALRQALEEDRCSSDTEFATWLYEDSTPAILKALLNEKSYDRAYLKTCADTIVILVEHLAQEIKARRLNYSFVSAMTHVFDTSYSLLNNFSMHYQQVARFFTYNEEWRKNLKKGDQVDINLRADERSKLRGWMQGTVVEEFEDDPDTITVKCLSATSYFDVKCSRYDMLLKKFGTKTEADYKWRNEVVVGSHELEVKIHDKSNWNQGFIRDFKTIEVTPGRPVLMAHCALRVYRPELPDTHPRRDERGPYIGFSDKFDEWVPVFTPRIVPFDQDTSDIHIQEIDDSLDHNVESYKNFSKVYGVPRSNNCISEMYLHLLNTFGNTGAFDHILQIIKDTEEEITKSEQLLIQSCLIQILCKPWALYHNWFIKEKGDQIMQAIRSKLLAANDSAMRDIRKEQVDGLIYAINCFNKRVIKNPFEQIRQAEILKLDLCNKSLVSNFLERRIQGIRDLQDIVKSCQTLETFSSDFMITWMQENNVFESIWDPKKTHSQILQRSNEIFKLLVKEDKMSESMLKLFWSLTKDQTYQSEVFKIVQEAASYFKPNHVEFLFKELTSQPVDKMTAAEFDCLVDLGKCCTAGEFQEKVSEFFWQVCTSPHNVKKSSDLVDNCIKKYAKVMETKLLETKKDIWVRLLQKVVEGESSKVSSLKLFTKMISDAAKSPKATTQIQTKRVLVSTVTEYKDGKYWTTKSYSDGVTVKQSSISPPSSTSITNNSSSQTNDITQVLNSLQSEHKIIDLMLQELNAYCLRMKKGDFDSKADVSTLSLSPQHYSHKQELQSRLNFLRFYATNCDYEFGKAELELLFHALSDSSPFDSDKGEFLNWCKYACQSELKNAVNLNEMSDLLTDLQSKKLINYSTLNLIGLEFLQSYFLSVNESESRVIKITPKAKPQVEKVQSYSIYMQSSAKADVEEDGDGPNFELMSSPAEMDKLDMIWDIVEQVISPVVQKKAIRFLIDVYISINDSLDNQKAAFVQLLINRCIQRLKESGNDHVIKQHIKVLKTLITLSEVKGLAGVKPHNALLKGEVFDKLVIKDQTIRDHFSSQKNPNLAIKALSSATCWEFIDKVSRMIHLNPQYCQFKFKEHILQESDYGKTLGELGFQNRDIITVEKLRVKEPEVDKVDLIDPATGKLTTDAQNLINEWFDEFSNNDGVMTTESARRFMLRVTHEMCDSADDTRIRSLFNAHDSDKDGILQREEFLEFYETAANNKPGVMYENMLNAYVLPNLVKFEDMYESQLFKKEELPRWTLSANQDHFDTLLKLLDNPNVQEEVWELIRSLQTNQSMYQQVLQLNCDKENEQEFWKDFFESGSGQKRSYQYEIIEALLEDNQFFDDRVFFLHFLNETQHYDRNQLHRYHESQAKKKESDDEVRAQWSKRFLALGGLQYCHDLFLRQDVGVELMGEKEIKEVKPLLSILRVYLTSVILCSQSKELSEAMKPSIQLETEMIQPVIQKVQWNKLQEKLYTLVSNISSKRESISVDEKLICKYALDLWMHCQIYLQDQPNFQKLSEADLENFLMTGVLYSSEETIKKNFREVFATLISIMNLKNDNSLENKCIHILSKNFKRISEYPCTHFFDLFNELIDMHFTSAETKTDVFDAENLLSNIIDKIRADKHAQIDTSLDEITQDQLAHDRENLLIGLIALTAKLIQKVDTKLSEKIVREKDLISEIFKEFLFASVFAQQDNVTSQDQTMLEFIRNKKAKKSKKTVLNQSREAAYELIISLVRKSPVIMSDFLEQQMWPLLDKIQKPKCWNYQPPTNSTNRIQKYVGLRNLGCICYMNSMMQQFFMVPAFRYNILCANDNVPLNMVEHKNEQIDDNLLHQVQKLFAHLELSDRSDYNPIGFTFAFKEVDGQPTNTAEQKDAQEFLNFFLDRLEQALKPTPKRHLVTSIFGGKICQQLLCPNCGKVKNRYEDSYYLSLTVKDLDSVQSSLQKQVEGEIINDYQCSGCKQKVDITKRTLIAQTPNVLIVHLQRLVFDFETFQNEKLNSYIEFPNILDLKEYSYHEVMAREQTQLKRKLSEQEVEEEQKLKEQQEASKEKKEDEEKDDLVLEEDDCFEYKLVGVNVHSGSANAGHYWSYINTQRGQDEKDPNDAAWSKTENEEWMEFNDSRVSNFKFTDLKEECFGEKQNQPKQTNMMGWGGMVSYATSTSYGKSAYMLFYERRKKKPIIETVSEEQAKQMDQDNKVEKDPNCDMYLSAVDFKQMCNPSDQPNPIFSRVLEDNTKFKFETDIYSKEFFEFIKTILIQTAQFGSNPNSEHRKMRKGAIKIAKKASFDILARCYHNQDLKDLLLHMVKVFEQDAQLVDEFLQQVLETGGEILFEIIVDANDQVARVGITDLFKYLLCRCKMNEKDKIRSDECCDSTTAQMLSIIITCMQTRCAKQWTRLEAFFSLIQAVVFYSDQQMLTQFAQTTTTSKEIQYDMESEAAKLGIELVLRMGWLESLFQFILKQDLNSMYNSPNVTTLISVCTAITGQVELMAAFPQSDNLKQMMMHKTILSKMLEDKLPSKQLSIKLESMCKDNFEMSYKIAKILFNQFNGMNQDKAQQAIKSVRLFLQIDDQFKQQRIEWLLGISQINCLKLQPRYQFGKDQVNRINDEVYSYKSTLNYKIADDALLHNMVKKQGRNDQYVLQCLKELMKLACSDEHIARYLWEQKAPTYQTARYTDWFESYIRTQIEENSKYSGIAYYQDRIRESNKAFAKLEKFKEVINKFHSSELQRLESLKQEQSFDEARKQLMFDHPDVMKHCPPRYIIGEYVNDPKNIDEKTLAVFDNEVLQVRLCQVQAHWAYSNPTGLFNLSLSDKTLRMSNFQYISYQQFKERESQQSGEEILIDERDWDQHKQVDSCILQLLVQSKHREKVTAWIKISTKNESDFVNVELPTSAIKDQVIMNDLCAVAHFEKIYPGRPWGCEFDISVECKIAETTSYLNSNSSYSQVSSQPLRQNNLNRRPAVHSLNLNLASTLAGSKAIVICDDCSHENDQGNDFCEKCGHDLDLNLNDSV